MKKFLIIAAIVLTAGWLAVRQHSRLKSLRAEVSALTEGNPAARQASSRSAGRSQGSPEKTALTDQGSADLRALMLEVYQVTIGGDAGADAKDKLHRLLDACSRLSHADAARLLADLANDSSFPDEMRQGAHEIVFDLMRSANPRAAFLLVFNDPSYPERGSRLGSAFHAWAMRHPKDAALWHEQHASELGDLITTPSFAQTLAIACANTDADRALSLALESSGPNAANNIRAQGEILAQNSRNTAAHQAFLAAFDRAEKSAADPQVVREARAGYVRGISNDMHQWPFEEAVSLIDGCLREDEKQLAIEQISHRGDLAHRGQWADWLSKLEAPADDRHPLVGLIMSWTHTDPEGAGNWLDQAAPGDLRNKAIIEHAFQLAGSDPEGAANWTLRLPEGKRRDKIQGQVLKIWKSTDAGAASRFAAAHGVPMP